MFSTSTITQINPPQQRGNFAYVSWTSTSPTGTWFQIYINGVLFTWTTQTFAYLPIPPAGSDRIVIGTVAAGEEQTSFASSLPAAPDRRVAITWTGGTTEGLDLAGFHVYASPSPGTAVSYTTPVATVVAFPAGIPVGAEWDTDGWDTGAWDAAVGTYSWTSGALANGTWTFAIVPFDSAGNETRPGQVGTATVVSPPGPPTLFSDGLRLHYTILGWDQTPFDTIGWSLPEVDLTWNASPG